MYVFYTKCNTIVIYIMFYFLIPADNDPHFVVKMKGTDEHFCFDVDGRDGESYQLIYDSETSKFIMRNCFYL